MRHFRTAISFTADALRQRPAEGLQEIPDRPGDNPLHLPLFLTMNELRRQPPREVEEVEMNLAVTWSGPTGTPEGVTVTSGPEKASGSAKAIRHPGLWNNHLVPYTVGVIGRVQ